jgi:hypothetical protein
MDIKEIGKINSLTSDWLYHEQEIRRGSDKSYHEGQQKKDEKLLFEMMSNIVDRNLKNK